MCLAHPCHHTYNGVYWPCMWYITCSDNVGQFDAVWDRGSMVAVNVGDRER